MECKKILIKNRKGLSSAYGVVLSILLIIAVFSGFFLFYSENLTDAGVSVDAKYTNLQANLTARQSEIDNKSMAVRDALQEIQETESGIGAAYYGLKGFGKSILLLIGLVTTGIGFVSDIIIPLDIIPIWLKSVITIAVVVVIVFALLKATRGGGSDI